MRITKLQQFNIDKSFELLKNLEPSIMLVQDKNIISISVKGVNSCCIVLKKGFYDFWILSNNIARATGKISLIIKVNQHAY